MNSIICPISYDRINKPTVRFIGFLTALLAITYIITGQAYILLFLIYEFYIRSFTKKDLSLLAFAGRKLSKSFNLKPNLIDKAPKLFAARVGLLLTLISLGLYFVSPLTSLIVMSILVFFALLESLFDFCVGCVIYTYLILPLNKG